MSKHIFQPFVLLAIGALAMAGCQQSTRQPRPLPSRSIQADLSRPQTFSADALFAFGKARLKGSDSAELDGLAQQLRNASQIDAVQVVGYTDRIGSDAANQKLSEQRADTVRDYLVAHGVAGDLISTEGRGPADPVVTCDDLKGKKKLIACLAPNRRVVVSTRSRMRQSAPIASSRGPAHAFTRTIWIGPHLVRCNDNPGTQCYRVREQADGPWKLWHGQIQGFRYVEGTSYELAVRPYRADGIQSADMTNDLASRYVFTNGESSNVVWVLDHVVSQTPQGGG